MLKTQNQEKWAGGSMKEEKEFPRGKRYCMPYKNYNR